MSDVWLYVRLAAATAFLLAPGWVIARALGIRGLSATLTWSLTALFVAMSATFLVSGSMGLALALLIVFGLAAAPFAAQHRASRPLHGVGAVGLAGLLLGIALWHVAGEIGGDGFFHLARARKLLDLGDLSLERVGEFPDGGLHPGYAFPLWHGFLALVAKVSGADPAEVVLHLPSILLPLVAIVGFEAARLVFGRTVPAAAATAAGIAMVGMAPSHGGALTALALPATVSRQLLVPAALTLALLAMRVPDRATLASAGAASLVVALVHPTYAIFLWIPFSGFVAVRWLWTRQEARQGGLALAALVVPAAAFFAWLAPVIRDTVSVGPDRLERARAIEQYSGQLDVRSLHSFSVTPELFGRAGAVAVAALVLLPLAAFAARRRWAAFAVGGATAVFIITLLPFVFTPFSDLVSLSQSRRLAGFLPFGIALAGGIGVLAALIGRRAIAVAAVLGVGFQLLYPGDFGYTLENGGPAWATWTAVLGCLFALWYGMRGRPPIGATAGLAALALLLPTYLHGFANWSPSPARPPSPLSDGLVAALRELPPGTVVYSDPEASYRIGAFAPVYVCVNPPGHVADTVDNHPRQRVVEFRRFVRTGDLAIPRDCGAEWLVVDRSRFDGTPDLPVRFEDERWRLYAL